MDDDERKLDELGQRFMTALARKEKGDVDRAEDDLRAILRVEPRLGEPHLELARLLLDTDRIEEAEDHARTALEILLGGGQWTDEVPENELQALAHATLAEVLRRLADEDEVIFGDREHFDRLVKEAREHFSKAAELDPRDEYSSYHAFYLDPTVVKPEVGEA